MKRSVFFKVFPVPKYLEISKVGIDISDESIKYVKLSRRRKGYHLKSFGEAALPPGTVVSGKIVNKEGIISVLSEIRKKNNFHYIHASLPEEESFVTRMVVPCDGGAQLRESVLLQLEGYIPLSADQVNFDFEIYKPPQAGNSNCLLGVYSTPKSLVAEYTEVLNSAGLIPASLEIEVQSVARALVPKNELGTYLIVDLGRTRTSFSVVSRGMVMFASTIKSVGGDNLTEMVSKALEVSFEEAEGVKIKKGMINSEENKKVFEAILPVASIFKDELDQHFSFWNNLQEGAGVSGKIEKVIFCGGQSTLPGLVEYIAADLSVPISIGDPWGSFLDVKKDHPPIPLNDALRYVGAIGLALRGMNHLSK